MTQTLIIDYQRVLQLAWSQLDSILMLSANDTRKNFEAPFQYGSPVVIQRRGLYKGFELRARGVVVVRHDFDNEGTFFESGDSFTITLRVTIT